MTINVHFLNLLEFLHQKNVCVCIWIMYYMLTYILFAYLFICNIHALDMYIGYITYLSIYLIDLRTLSLKIHIKYSLQYLCFSVWRKWKHAEGRTRWASRIKDSFAYLFFRVWLSFWYLFLFIMTSAYPHLGKNIIAHTISSSLKDLFWRPITF